MKLSPMWGLAAALFCALSCHEDAISTDGNTSWIGGCVNTADCHGEGRACVKGRCTLPSAPSSVVTDSGLTSGSLSNGSATPSDGIADAALSSEGAAPNPDVLPDAALSSCPNFAVPAVDGSSPISFRQDLLPIFGQSCNSSDCHNPVDQKAGLNLGYKCGYDAAAKWNCTFPPDDGPWDTVAPHADDEQTIQAVYASLLAAAMTVNDGTLVSRVAPGDPENSFLVLKLAGVQNSRGYVCANQDTSHEANPQPCGAAMPQTGDALCLSSPDRFDAIVRWVAQGAPNN